MYLPFIYKNPVILSLLKIVTLNFTMYVLTIWTCTLKMYVIRKIKFYQKNLKKVFVSGPRPGEVFFKVIWRFIWQVIIQC